MPEVGTRDIPLNWDVLITPGIPIATSDLPPGTKQAYVSGDSVNPHLWHAGRRPGGCLYDSQAGQCFGRLDCSKRSEPDNHLHYPWPWRPLVWNGHFFLNDSQTLE